jgi:hypothetical protein
VGGVGYENMLQQICRGEVGSTEEGENFKGRLRGDGSWHGGCIGGVKTTADICCEIPNGSTGVAAAFCTPREGAARRGGRGGGGRV